MFHIFNDILNTYKLNLIVLLDNKYKLQIEMNDTFWPFFLLYLFVFWNISQNRV